MILKRRLEVEVGSVDQSGLGPCLIDTTTALPLIRAVPRGQGQSRGSAGSELNLQRCLIVGRPWGQFQGWCKPDRPRSILVISPLSSARPTMMDERHARLRGVDRRTQCA